VDHSGKKGVEFSHVWPFQMGFHQAQEGRP
jgi:hypothetical protein